MEMVETAKHITQETSFLFQSHCLHSYRNILHGTFTETCPVQGLPCCSALFCALLNWEADICELRCTATVTTPKHSYYSILVPYTMYIKPANTLLKRKLVTEQSIFLLHFSHTLILLNLQNEAHVFPRSTLKLSLLT